jgi:hypothetical protein
MNHDSKWQLTVLLAALIVSVGHIVAAYLSH